MIRCPQCGSFDCGPVRCRFTDETHASYRDREVSLAMIQRTIETGGYLCECPSWWGCSVRGCYEAAKDHAGSVVRKPMPGDRNYLNSSSRTEDRIHDAVYFGGTPHKRGM